MDRNARRNPRSPSWNLFFLLFVITYFVATTTTFVVSETTVTDTREENADTVSVEEHTTLSDEDETDVSSTATDEADELIEEANDNTTEEESSDPEAETTETPAADDDEETTSEVESEETKSSDDGLDNPPVANNEDAVDDSLATSAEQNLEQQNTEVGPDPVETESDLAAEETKVADEEPITKSSEKTTKSKPEDPQGKKKDMEGGENIAPPAKSASGSAKKKTGDETPKKAMMNDGETDKSKETLGKQSTQNAEEKQGDPEETVPLVEEQPELAEEKEAEYPVYEENSSGDDDEDPVIDLDSHLKQAAGADSKEREERAQEEGGDVDTTKIASSEVVEEEEDMEDKKARVRAQFRADRQAGRLNTTTTVNTAPVNEVPSAATTESYRGEPWGQYRSSRRLPDRDLLRLLFEGTQDGGTSGSNGDAKSEQVLKDWQKDPLYDENTVRETGAEEPLILDEKDEKFMEYRSQLLGGNRSGNSNGNSKSPTTDDDQKEGTEKINNVDANTKFVEGIDKIDDFFDDVDPPVDFDSGYGSSIQDVLIDKGKHILLQKARQVAGWIQAGWKAMGRDLEGRISQFQIPFQKVTTTAPDLDSGAVKSSKSSSSNEGSGVAEMKEKIISAWKTGKRAYEKVSDLVDGLLDKFDGQSGDDATNFDDFKGFDLNDLSTMKPPS